MSLKKQEVTPEVREFLKRIASIGGKNGSHADKVRAGKMTSRRKRKAARLNGKLGGRPVTDVGDKLAIKK